MKRTIRRLGNRLFRPTLETVGILIAFCFVGIVLNGLWIMDHQSTTSVKWKNIGDDTDQQSPRHRVRKQQFELFMRERDQLRQELEKLRQEEDNEEPDDRSKPETRASPGQSYAHGRTKEDILKRDFQEVAAWRHGDEILKVDGGHNEMEFERKLPFDGGANLDKPQFNYNMRMMNKSASDYWATNRRRRRFVTEKMGKDRVHLHKIIPQHRHQQAVNNNSNHRSSTYKEVADRRWCTVYNTTPEVSGIEYDFDCVRLRIKPATTICLYGDDDDIHVSRHLREDGLWEPHEVRLFQNLLFQNPDLDVIDIGAQIGQYSLLAAAMGRRVVAVEPLSTSILRLHKAIKIGHLEDKIVLVINPVSNARGEFIMDVPDGNQGGASLRYGTSIPCEDADGNLAKCPSNLTSTIVMDDLLEVVGFQRAVMKIDIEGHEHRAFSQADQLFDHVTIPYVFMEWIKLRAFYGAEVDDTEDKRRTQRLVDWFTDRGYVAYSLILIQQLNVDYWYGWPDDIIWQHVDADPFF